MAAIRRKKKKRRDGNPVIPIALRRWLVRGMWLALLIVIVAWFFVPARQEARDADDQLQARLEAASGMEAQGLWLAAADEYEEISRSARMPKADRIAADLALARIYAEELVEPEKAQRALEHAYYLSEDAEAQADLKRRIDELASAGSGGRATPSPAAPPVAGEGAPDAAPEDVVGRVGDRLVGFDEILAAFQEQTQRESGTREELAAFTNQYLQLLAVAEAAREQGLDRRPEIERAVRKYEDQMLIQKMFEQAEPREPAEGEAEDYYQANREEFSSPARAAVGHIVVRTRDEAERVGERLAAGEDFRSVAQEISLDADQLTSATIVGAVTASDVFIPYIGLVHDLPAKLVQEEEGFTTGPIESPRGFHWVRVEEKREAGPRPFNEIREKAEAALQQSLLQEAQRGKLEDAVRIAPVRVHSERLEREIAKIAREKERDREETGPIKGADSDRHAH